MIKILNDTLYVFNVSQIYNQAHVSLLLEICIDLLH